MTRLPPRQPQPKVTSSVAVKTPSLRARSEPSDPTRQSQLATKPRPGASPKLVRAKAAAARRDREEDVDTLEQAERILREIGPETGHSILDSFAQPAWMNHMDELKTELVAVWQEESLIDLSVLSTFEDAAVGVPMTDDVTATTMEMMNAGFELFHEKLEHKKRLQLRAVELMEAIRVERMKHPISEFSTDVNPELDPDFDPDDEE